MQYLSNLGRRLKNLFSRKRLIYKTIDELPCGVWNEVQTSGNTGLLHYDKHVKQASFKSENAWRSINKELVERFGWTQEYKERLLMLKRIALLRIEAQLTGKRHLNTIANAYQAELDAESNKSKSLNFTQSIAILEKELGFIINVDTFPTSKYLQHIHLLNKTKSNG